jgi:hypothetical protein
MSATSPPIRFAAPPSPTTPETEARSQEPPKASASLPPAAPEAGEAAAQPLPPPVADPADPYQTRALAAGLHPGLSRVLLTRLSPADYRNAGIAIKTALAETPDDGVFVFPPQRTPELALFNVRFVQGAASGCRRYVVTITKDGWLTTALPMEKCGLRPVLSRRG